MKRLSDLQRMEVVDREGNRLGHVFDLMTRMEEIDAPPRVEGFLVGRGGLARRLGIRRGSAREVRLEDVHEVREGRIVVALPEDA